tara:strand:- start:2899 stop:3477 length:579 start_codon:yes stop_codon:yes gene_type:complete
LNSQSNERELILNEEILIQNCIGNNRRAQETLYSNYYKELYLIAMRYLSDHHDAEDAIILCFTKVFKNLNTFNYQGQGSLGKWIRTILINESIRLLNKRNQFDFQSDLESINLPITTANSLEQMQASDILQLIEALPTGYRTIFNLYAIEGFSHKEIAALLKISENTSKTQLKKARTSLMNSINKEKAYGTN